jgi:hypothetical protein
MDKLDVTVVKVAISSFLAVLIISYLIPSLNPYAFWSAVFIGFISGSIIYWKAGENNWFTGIGVCSIFGILRIIILLAEADKIGGGW